MINFNGTLQDNHVMLDIENRALNYGDAIFETVKVVNGKPLFFEDHYFRLMASMRILRMEIPMNFTQEFLESEIERVLDHDEHLKRSARVKVVVYRNSGGRYLPETNTVSYIISAQPLTHTSYGPVQEHYEVALFKDFFVPAQLLSTLKSTNKALNVVASIFASENGYANCLLMNTNKMIVEACNSNLFLVNDHVVKTPPLSDGCLNGILRKQIIALINADDQLVLEEASISPFELQKADELFLTNVIQGIQPINKYKKKEYTSAVSSALLSQLNQLI